MLGKKAHAFDVPFGTNDTFDVRDGGGQNHRNYAVL